MNLFRPIPTSYQLFDPIDLESVRMITVWPGQQLVARIERKRLDEVFLDEEWRVF